ncbi:RloB domain-containing protein [Bacillus sp. FJAT-22090]|uniref:RloB domain-containing protein n=1 Tax=Bacillus sp. FJAT-22090 TaxID=1581038 RepID=UPI0011A0593C|nr:RloB domain-containing protein [Bacillus sp. FJAT-22090]
MSSDNLFKKNKLKRTLATKQLAPSEHKIQLAYSIESFELWYILHFEFLNVALDRNQYINKLKRYLGKYEKNDPKVYDKIHQAGGSEKQASFNYC